MAEITANLVKTLRERSGAGMMDCKKALTATSGDLEAAVDWLRKQGLAAAAKKASRIASEGVVAVAATETEAAVVEVNCETDFVARNATFQAFAADVAKIARGIGGDVEALKSARLSSGALVAETLTQLVATIGENISVRRGAVLKVGKGVVAHYVHNQIAPGLGKIAVLVGLESTGDTERLRKLGHQIAMHIAAANPQWATIDAVDKAALERERVVLADQARTSGKPEAVIAKMVEGRLRKFYEETVLLEQIFVVDNETKISKVIETAAKDIGAPVNLMGFLRFALGEGIERQSAK